MKLKKILTTLSFIAIIGGVSVPMTACNSGTNSSTTSATSQGVYLNSSFIDNSILKNNKAYNLIVLDSTTGKVLVNDLSFSCDQLTRSQGCSIQLPAYTQDDGELIFLLANSNSLVAATIVSKSFLPLGLNHIYFNEDTTGDYIYDNLSNVYALLGNDVEVRRSMYGFFELDPDNYDDDISFNVMLYKLYSDYQKIYGENTFYFMVDLFTKNDMDIYGGDLEQSAYDESDLDQMIEKAGTSRITSSSMSVRTAAASSVPPIETFIPGGCISIELSGNSYVCKQAGGMQSSYDKNVVDNKIVEMKQADEEYQKIWKSNLTPAEKSAKAKELADKRLKDAAGLVKDLTPSVKQVSSMISDSMQIKVSKDTQATLDAVQTMITVIGAVGNIWLPGVSSAIAGLANGVLQGIFGGNEGAIKANPNAAMEAILNQISQKMDTVNNSILGISSKLNDMENNKAAVAINKYKSQIRVITDKYTPYAADMLEYADNRGESFSEATGYLANYLNSGDEQVQRALAIFNSNDKKYDDLTTSLNSIFNPTGVDKSQFTVYLSSYNTMLTDDLKNASGSIFSPSKNKIKIVQEYNVSLFNYMLDIVKVTNEVANFYKIAAYLKYVSGKPEFKNINLGDFNTSSYNSSVRLIESGMTKRNDALRNMVERQIKTNIAQVEGEYLYQFNDSLKYKFQTESDPEKSCEAQYWDGKTFVGRCGGTSFVIPNLSSCKDRISESDGKISCPIFSFANSEMFEEGTAGKNRSVALANMLKMKSDYIDDSGVDAAYIAAEWSEGKKGIQYNSLNAKLSPFMEAGEATTIFMTKNSRKDCFNDIWDGYNNHFWGRRNYPVLGAFLPNTYNYLYINQAFHTRGDTCPGGVEYAKWWVNGKLYNWSASEVNSDDAIQRTYVDIDDSVTLKKFVVPMITTYTKPLNYYIEYTYHTTLACVTSDCIIINSGAKESDGQKPAVIGWLGNNLDFEPTIYSLGIQDPGVLSKSTTINPLASISSGYRGVFAITKSDVDFYTNKGSLTPSGTWLKCNGRQFRNGMAVSAASCTGSGASGKFNQKVATLDWANSCVPGSPVDVNTSGNLVCRYPR